MTTKARDWWLKLPWPLWTLASCKPFSPWCLIDDLAHAGFPMTFGFYNDAVSHDPIPERWICRKHTAVIEKYMRRKHPEDFQDEEELL